MAAVQQPVYGNAGNTEFMLFYGTVAHQQADPATPAEIVASQAWTKRSEFLAEIASRGLITSEVTFEQYANNYTVANDVPHEGVGAYAAQVISNGRFYSTPASTTDNGTAYPGLVRVPQPSIHGRANFAPPDTGTKYLDTGKNAIQFVFESGTRAFGLWIQDLMDINSGSNPRQHVPYFILGLSTGELLINPKMGLPFVDSNDAANGITNATADFIGFVCAAGQTISYAILRWGNYAGQPSLTNFAGVDGIIVAKAP